MELMAAQNAQVQGRVGSKEMARRLKISTRTLQNYRDSGRIPYSRYSARCFRYDPIAVEAALSK